ncbi:hypothetical protein MKK70_01275 [Methylobacterium sp. E-041]|jgi:hypothetical protein|uniref:hypothetical protein n=1 Tax=unclassified Methylobacterium TaxID=2615210 RepID=UPI0011C90DBF|nr:MULTISPECIES: hypothetical protein [unclassified Methylobacterium]MCJ2020975.1 hypothetical protein [Methylobacterium sp. E-065]MCJ2104036.1 hypothetical protein [Methylobacterium sp. E-041]MCJ2117309.1 hypothetical protein [Methylobacterium sp. J-001]MCJ2130412.1 hypothetical protein [Methylobacterium sp. E-045]TXN73543.1 hypothetical protein FV230_01005 [Methylobacterium sp. WL6]
MARQDKRARLKSIVTDGTMAIPEVEGEWHHDPYRTLWVEVSNLKMGQAVSTDYGTISRTPQISGMATIRRDTVRLAGWGDTCRVLPVTIRPAIPQEDGNGYTPFTSVLGFIAGDWEFKSEDAWFLECWIPEMDMAAMLAAYRAGEMPSFHLGVKLDLWIMKGDEHTPPGYGVTWYLAPHADHASESPEVARGTVRHLSWSDAPQPKVDEDDGVPEQGPPPQAPADPAPNLDAANLTAAIDRLRSTVLQVGLGIGVALVVSWFV